MSVILLQSPVIVIGTPRSGTSIVAKWLMDNYNICMDLDGYTDVNEKCNGLKNTYEDKIVTGCNSKLNLGKMSLDQYKERMTRYFRDMESKANGGPWGFKDPRLLLGLRWIIEHFDGNLTLIRTKRRAKLVMDSLIKKANFTPENAAKCINAYETHFQNVLRYPGLVVIDVRFDGSDKMPEDFIESFDQSLVDRRNMMEVA